MDTVRTPDDRFVGLPDYDFEPHYVEIDDTEGGSLRAHYIDEGDPADPIVVLMHGEPSWCYLYRNVVGPLVDAGCRVIVPDLVGFGRSDKPTQQGDHTYARHVNWMTQVLIDHLTINDAVMFGQDWGGLIGLRVVAAAPERFAALVMANTGLPTGHGRLSDAFLQWQTFARETASFPVGAIINGGCTSDLPTEVIAAYDAPFPDDVYTAGARVLPSLVPSSPDDPASADNIAAWDVLERFERPVATAFSDADPITAGGDAPFRSRIPGAAEAPHIPIAGGGHFLQEDRPVEVAAAILQVVSR